MKMVFLSIALLIVLVAVCYAVYQRQSKKVKQWKRTDRTWEQ